MKFTNYTVFYHDYKKHGIEYALEHTSRLGFDSVEFLDVIPKDVPACDMFDKQEVRRLLEKYRLGVACCSAAVDLTADGWDAVFDTVRRSVGFAAFVGSPFFHHTLVPQLTLTESSPSYEDIFEKVVCRAKMIADCCKEKGIVCLYEPQGMYFNGVDGLMPFFTRIRLLCDNVGICGDTGNSLFADVPAADIYKAFINDIKHVHIKDYRDCTSGGYITRGGRRIDECMPGDGDGDFDCIFRLLDSVGYDGAISVEMDGGDDMMQAVRDFVKKRRDAL